MKLVSTLVVSLQPPVYMKSLFPKGARSTFGQNRVTNIMTLFSLRPTFRKHLRSEYNEQKEVIVNSIFSFS